MRRLVLFVHLLMVLLPVVHNAQRDSTGITTLAKAVFIRIQARDGSDWMGLFKCETETQLTILDFNVGTVSLVKSWIKSEQRAVLDSMILVETTNDMQYAGYYTGMQKGCVVLNSRIADSIYIPAFSIKNITVSHAYLSRRGGLWFHNPNATRYFFAPSAIPLSKKEGYFQNAYLLANSANVGLTSHITVGGGVVIPFLFYVTPKWSYAVGKHLYVGAGVLYTQSFISDINIGAGIGYGLITLGNAEHNLTLGAGYGVARSNNEYRETPMPVVTVNGMTRIGKKVSLITENWFIPRSGYSVLKEVKDPNGNMYMESVFLSRKTYGVGASAGIRMMPGIRSSIDFAVVAIQSDPVSNPIVIPYLDFVYKFDW